MELRYDLRKIGIHHEDDDLDAHEATKLLIKEVERLREYERLVKFISRDYIELSHEKVAWQRDDWRKRCIAVQQKDSE